MQTAPTAGASGRSVDLTAGWQSTAALVVGTRLALTLVGIAGVALLGEGPRRLDLAPDFPWLELWAQWDSEHYLRIATEGYSYAPGTFSNIPFFPLYPLLIRLVMVAVGRVDTQTGALVGFVISNVALFVALLYLAALVARDLSLSTARRTVVYVLVFPMTFFLSAVYAESLFLATGAACIYHARQGEWYRSGLAGGLAALTRPYGFLLVIPIALEMLRQRPALRFLPSIALVPAGLATYLAYLWWQFGTPTIYFEANAAWGRGFHNPIETLLAYLRGPLVLYDWPYAWLDLVSMVAMVVLVVRRLAAHPAQLLGLCRGRRPVRLDQRHRLVLGLAPRPGALPDHHHPGRARRAQPRLWHAVAGRICAAVGRLLRALRGRLLGGLNTSAARPRCR